ncbi:hypothetical protein RND71_007757 [Anisodus tanguticus]|uniref:Essential protein Yae1 N-terminal domain-containing protein n=1 Tax=Anisodus tanguticus TaxID=243964 RepID=A0AAE1SJK9_9SOLA|nr:hypothetical protein RND71_007757 [Anisodus tanguticus]
MERRIKNELYSDIFDMSNLQSSLRSTINSGNTDSHEKNRDGIMAGKEASAQEGFNVGFRDSVYVGYNWGLVRVSRSTTEMLKVFHDYLSKKSEESGKNDNSSSCLADYNDLSSSVSLFENYQKELQALIHESGLKLHLDTKE